MLFKFGRIWREVPEHGQGFQIGRRGVRTWSGFSERSE
jgi:hypothetical protein